MASLTPLRLGLFSGSAVLGVARDHGHLAQHGIQVHDEAVPSSQAQFASLLNGRYDLVLTGPDNVLAYRLDPTNPLGDTFDVRILAPIDRGLGLSLIGGPGIRKIEDIRGKSVAVDVPDSGFAFVLYHLLADEGLRPGADFDVTAAGATPRRRAALLAGEFAATLLGAGHDVVAVQAGCHRLRRAAESVRPFLGTVLAGTGEWTERNRDLIHRFCTAWFGAAAELVHPAGRRLARMEAKVHLGLSGTAGQEYCDALVSAEEGLITHGDLDMASLIAVARLRAAYGRLNGIEPEPAALLATGLVDEMCLTGLQR